jgi:cytoskeletal protein RodZ
MPPEDRSHGRLAMTMAEDRPVDFGTFLRLAREQRGVSLQDLAVATKISVRVLQALERNDPSKLPGGIFSRSFVRSYAREVGLDPEVTAAKFVSAFPEESGADEMPAATSAVEAESYELRRRALMIAARVAGVALLAALVAFVYYSRFRPRDAGTGSGGVQPPAAAEAAAAPAQALPQVGLQAPEPVPSAVVRGTPQAPGWPEAAAAADPGRAEQAAAPPAEPAPPSAQSGGGEPSGSAAEPQAPLVVVLTLSDPCWIAVSVDGARTPSRTAAAGERLEFPVARSITMTLGNAGAVAMTLNGRPARALGVPGQVMNLTITASDYESFLR